jgi:hypothetical protein
MSYDTHHLDAPRRTAREHRPSARTAAGIIRPAVRRIGLTLAAALTLAACGSGGGSTGPGDGDSPRTDVPAALVGTWYNGSVSPTNFYDPSTGRWGSPGYSDGMFFTFTRDGRFEKGTQLTSSLGGCGTLTMFYVRGTVTVDQAAGTVALHATRARGLEENSCSGRREERPLDLAAEGLTYRYGFGADGNGDHKLWLLGPSWSNWAPFTPTR